MDDASAPIRCVVVLPRGGGLDQAPASLLDGLSQRRLDVVVAATPPAAMVELARRPTAVLVMVDPAPDARGRELLQAVKTYYPRVACWRFDRQGVDHGHLSAINGSLDHPRTPGNSPGKFDPVEDEELQRVLGTTRQRIEPLVTHMFRPTRDTTPLISEQELAMLLGDDDPAWRESQGG